MTLPARTAVLAYVDKMNVASVQGTMAALKDIYGQEKQFTKDMFLEHFMALAANGMLELDHYELCEHDELDMYYKITEEGRATVKKYVSSANG